MRTGLVFALVAVTVAITAGCGGSGDSGNQSEARGSQDELGAFFETRFDHELKGQYGRSWDSLHPGQQEIVSRSMYDDCRRQSSDELAGLQLKSLKVVEVYDDPIDVPGVPETTSKAVTMELTLEQGSQSATTTNTVHAVDVDGHWAWVLPPSDIAEYQKGNCPS